jgi:hypothetical protein
MSFAETETGLAGASTSSALPLFLSFFFSLRKVETSMVTLFFFFRSFLRL